MQTPIYLDNHATTRCDPRVMEAMVPYFTTHFGNAASRTHVFGRVAEEAVDKARAQLARAIGATTDKEIVLTSGATESDNLAIKGAARMYRDRGDHLVTVCTEHKAVLDAHHALEREGFRVTFLPVRADGLVDLDELAAALTDQTILVSVMAVNNEIGVVQPLERIGRLCKDHGVLFFCDAAQAVGKVPIDVEAMHIDLLAFTAHKMYGPKGVGALWVRRKNPRVRLEPLFHGGGHERGLRSGTLAVPLVVAFGAAAELALNEMPEESARLLALRQRLWDGLRSHLTHLHLNGDWSARVPGNLNVSFAYVEGESLLMGIHDIAVSSGSACTSASLEPSYVLKALGVDDELAHTSIRFGIGRFNTTEEIDFTIARVTEVVHRLRDMSPLWEMVQEGIDLKTVHWAGH
ncbi:MAG: IscS subfamily cysteine desulfurase [Deltaproteobacteria bacterium]|nr:IscS subfamily cysteine desulfurase [Deltaproteobacteria bacterium]